MNPCSCSPCAPPIFSIFLGDAKTVPMKLQYSDTGNPFDLTACSQIVVNLPNADGSFAQLNLSSGVTIGLVPVLGQFTVAISSAVSALLNVGVAQNVDVTFTISSKPMTVRFLGCLTVNEV